MSLGRRDAPTPPRPLAPLAPTFSGSLKALSAAQKSGRGAPAYSRFINRRLGRVLAAAAHVAGLSPNAVTVISAIFTFTGIVVIALAPRSWLVAAAISLLLITGYALDAADGQLARLRGGGSVAGEWLDHMVDSVKITSLHVAVLIGVYRYDTIDEVWLLVPAGFAVIGASSFFAQILNEQLHLNRDAVRPTAGKVTSSSSWISSLLKIPTDYGLLCLVFLLLGSAELFMVAYGFLFLASTSYFALASVKWFRDMHALDAARRGF